MRLTVKTKEELKIFNFVSCLKVIKLQSYTLYLPSYKLSFYDHEKNKQINDLIVFAYKTEGE